MRDIHWGSSGKEGTSYSDQTTEHGTMRVVLRLLSLIVMSPRL